jgi:aspartate dehydrogenase
MVKVLKIGIVGCGAIGTSLAKIIVHEFFKKAELVALYDKVAVKADNLASSVLKNRYLAVGSLEALIRKSDLVIEAASAQSCWYIARKVMSCGRDIMIMSVGGITPKIKGLARIGKKYNTKVYIPSGAICGIDGLKAAILGKAKKVTLTTRKNPSSFKGVKYIQDKGLELGKIKKDTVLFSGTARKAMKLFPQNINVAGILSIAGIGEVKTHVKIVASPQVKNNIHEIQIESGAGKIFTRTQNVLHPDNPKTSYLAVLAAAATLKQIFEPVKVGT